jgi:hypothetical protein
VCVYQRVEHVRRDATRPINDLAKGDHSSSLVPYRMVISLPPKGFEEHEAPGLRVEQGAPQLLHFKVVQSLVGGDMVSMMAIPLMRLDGGDGAHGRSIGH